jgi:hypothetical protein
MDSAEHSPPRIIPQRGQVSENTSKPARSEVWGVLHEDVSRSHLANDPRHFSPQSASGAVDARTFSGSGDVLAREPASDDVHQSTPWPSIEGSHVVPDWEGVQASVVLAGEQDAPGVVVDFDGAHGAESTEESAEYAAASACE